MRGIRTRRLFQMPDGSITVLIVNEKMRLSGETDAQMLDREEARLREPNVSELGGSRPQFGEWFDATGRKIREAAVRVCDMDVDALPSRRFRDCWRTNGTGIHVDLPLARSQRLREIRTERDRRFAALDGEWFKAMGRGDAANAAVVDAKRQALRDVPQAAERDLAALTTPDALAAYGPVWPD